MEKRLEKDLPYDPTIPEEKREFIEKQWDKIYKRFQEDVKELIGAAGGRHKLDITSNRGEARVYENMCLTYLE